MNPLDEIDDPLEHAVTRFLFYALERKDEKMPARILFGYEPNHLYWRAEQVTYALLRTGGVDSEHIANLPDEGELSETDVRVIQGLARYAHRILQAGMLCDEPATSAELIEICCWLNDRLWEQLQEAPSQIRELTPRHFEEFVAELFTREGFDVDLTPPSNDGGRDIIAVRHDPIGQLRYIAECKKYREDRPVGIELVRTLYGTLMHDQATYGVLATTSRFTKGAQEFAQQHEWQIGLKDFEAIKQWFESLKTRETG